MWGSAEPLEWRYVTGVANTGLAIALGTPMEVEREQLGVVEAGLAGLSRKNI